MPPRSFKKTNVAVSGTFPGYKQGMVLLYDAMNECNANGDDSGPQSPGGKPRRDVQRDGLIRLYAFDYDTEGRGQEEWEMYV